MKKTIVILALLFLLALAIANAEPAGRDRRGVGMMYDEPVYYSTILTADVSLNLTAKQAARIRALDERYAQEMKSIQAQMYSKGSALKSEWLQARPNQDTITAHQRDVTKLRDQMREKMTSHHTDILEVLTPEQKARMQDNGPGRDFHKKAGSGRR